MYHSEDWVWSNPNWDREGILPVDDVEILQGTAFRFRGFIRGIPVTETVTATYIIDPKSTTRFSGVPVVSVTAPYADFLDLYGNTWRNAGYRRVFNYEYFTYFEGQYTRQFSLLGWSNLGGGYSRTNEQRTINVNFSRGELSGVITYPIFENLDELYRIRLWNGGSNFRWGHMPDSLAQTASSDLNVLFSDNQLAIKFINGEFWGFTTVREHTSNEDFIATRTGLDRGNILVTNRQYSSVDMIVSGDEKLGEIFLEELASFTTQADMSTDEARERLFDEFFDQKNFMDYLIANTFFHNTDWPHNNVRMFRVINPNPSLNSSYNSGKWHFILHDMDMTFGSTVGVENDNFSTLYERHPQSGEGINYYFLVFNNPTFVREFVDRAHYVLEHYFYPERLLALHDEFIEACRPLLIDMYKRFNMHGSVTESLEIFEQNSVQHLERFLSTREYYYRQQLDYLLERVGLNS